MLQRQANHFHAEYVLVEESLHLFISDVDAQLFVGVNGEVLESKNVQDPDRAVVTVANSKQIEILKKEESVLKVNSWIVCCAFLTCVQSYANVVSIQYL